MTKLLVLGAGSLRTSAFATWRSMGLSIHLVDGYSAARYEHVVDDFTPLDTRDGSADLAALVRVGERCDGVVTLSDDCQGTVAAVAESLGRPGIGSAAATAARSKTHQRSLCEQAGMPMPRWRPVRSLNDLGDFFADGDRRAVLKPVDSAGSSGVLRVGSLREAQHHWSVVRSLSPTRTAIIEDFLPGREVCVEAVVSSGEPAFVSVTEKQVQGPLGFVVVSLGFAALQPDREAATSFVRQLASAMGVTDGVVHAECKVDGEKWGLVEAGFRPGGDFISDLTARVTGVEVYRALAQLALGDKPSVTTHATPPAAFAQIRFLVGEGQVRQFVPPARVVTGLPDVRIVNQLFSPGQRVRLPLSNNGRAGYALGWGSDREDLDAQLSRAVVKLGHEMGLTVRGGEVAKDRAAT